VSSTYDGRHGHLATTQVEIKQFRELSLLINVKEGLKQYFVISSDIILKISYNLVIGIIIMSYNSKFYFSCWFKQ
jgi:hypothetical protein